MQSVDQEHEFAAQGYLALSPQQLQDIGTPQGRQWLAASTLADIRLTFDRSSLVLSVGVKETVYIRITIAERGPHGSLKQTTGPSQPKILTPQQTCSCWCLASIGANGSWCFRFQRSADAQQLTDRIRKLGQDMHGVDPHSEPSCAKQGSLLTAKLANASDPNTQMAGAQLNHCGGKKSSEQLRSMMQDVLRDPDFPELVRMVEDIWDQVNFDPLGW